MGQIEGYSLSTYAAIQQGTKTPLPVHFHIEVQDSSKRAFACEKESSAREVRAMILVYIYIWRIPWRTPQNDNFACPASGGRPPQTGLRCDLGAYLAHTQKLLKGEGAPGGQTAAGAYPLAHTPNENWRTPPLPRDHFWQPAI